MGNTVLNVPYNEEQIISILKEHEAGMRVTGQIRKHGVSEQSIYRGNPMQSSYFIQLTLTGNKRTTTMLSGMGISALEPYEACFYAYLFMAGHHKFPAYQGAQ